ncbi:MAG: DUF4058 family protein [Planctomycetes bacterium]|nr:DUF4058 family protein [Planctomycetota bacterium]
MPLRDHFHPPLKGRRHWESFHASWATEIMRTFNRGVLPEDCFAEAQVHVGSAVEIDIATLQEPPANGRAGGVAVATWSPPATTLVMPAVFPDVIEVQVIRDFGGPHLVGAIEMVSPGNKDRPDTRRAFVAKCAAYLQQGVGLVVIDVVTERLANLHNELIGFLQQPEPFTLPQAAYLYATAYRPRRSKDSDQIDLWLETLTLGQPMPTMPLALRGLCAVPVDLEGTYQRTCEDSRLP